MSRAEAGRGEKMIYDWNALTKQDEELILTLLLEKALSSRMHSTEHFNLIANQIDDLLARVGSKLNSFNLFKEIIGENKNEKAT